MNKKNLIERAIGIGGQAIVYLATFKGQKFAVKCFQEDGGIDRKYAENEIAIMDRLHHRNIIQKIDSFEELGHLFLVTEYCETDLFRVISGKNQMMAGPEEIFIQILDAVVYMHEKGVFHRDLKAGNILVQGQILKIADFGFATMETKLRGFAGSYIYESPEHRRGNEVSEKNDIFSLGVLLFSLYTGQFPWTKSETPKVLRILKNFLNSLKLNFD